MSARDKLRNCFPRLPKGASNALIEAAVDEILGDHARELVAKQKEGAERLFESVMRLGHEDLAVKVKIVLDGVIALVDPDLDD